MQDRFKFRIYDDIHRTMVYAEDVDVNPFNVSAYTQNNVMQCTGLKDCKSNLIYEGDIVQLDNYLKCTVKFHDKYDMDYGRIEFILIGSNPKLPTIYIPTVAKECVIIGNIYENKELLNEFH